MNVLIVVAHPDDEILGVGGAARLHVNNGDQVSVLILGKGAAARENISSGAFDRLRTETKNAAKIIGFSRVETLDFPDNRFDSIALLDIVRAVEKTLEKTCPKVVYTHHGGDVNVDHQCCFKAVMTACRPCNAYCPQKILSFETLSSTEWQLEKNHRFHPNVYVDIGKVIMDKVKAMEAYESEIRSWPHPRSGQGIKILANYRGLEAGLEYAEGLELVREIHRFC